MRRRVRSRFPFVAVIVAALILLRLFTRSFEPAPFSFDAGKSYRVQRVVDGDTLLLADGTRVRLLGVDTPETKHPDIPPEPLGFEASEFTRRHVEGRTVTLQFDRERRDRYHRVLAYVSLDDWMLNEELIRAGFSRAETPFPYSSAMKRRFRAAEKEARDNNRGLWANRDNR
ncbi:MAG: thermonuclease family protein [Planctomycetaceae bacterium]|jgi:micrococcal nuclease|nr:thermonuclease family protein [Planctomycetaceae bacterium]MBT6156467.1 thermonuclease family protein [Planctomycetaceae bacterium]MBT6485455.1 thermonuclease family protein [Planctomycetaceae bacterium]MBT6497251.1 thermonuclease family protein [Planctomycetaceae bacterium]